MTKTKKYKILVAAGGTGGHLYPAIAVIQQLEKISNNNLSVNFVGTASRIESNVVPSLGYDFHTIPISGLTSLFSLNTLTLPYKIIKSISICRKLIRDNRPDIVLCTGAYISFPAGKAAIKEGIPLVLMESNVNPGKTISILSAKAEVLITSFEQTIGYFNNIREDIIFEFGNPVREDLFNLPKMEDARLKFDLAPYKKTVLVFGGSLGALSINTAMEEIISNQKDDSIQYIWQTGNNYSPKFNVPANVKLLKYIDEMASAYAASDLVICRSGATTIAELTICAKPSILIPLPSATNNEQRFNAEVLERVNAAIILENDMIESQLYQLIGDNINDSTKLLEMADSARKLAKPNAALNSAKKIIEIIESNWSK